jgi:hypothetical protein
VLRSGDTGFTAVEDRQRLGADVFGELKVFEEAKTEGLKIVGGLPIAHFHIPAVDHNGTVFHPADGLLPLVPVIEIAAFDDTAAGKSNKAGVHIGQQLDEVGAEAAGSFLPRMPRKKRQEIQVNTTLSLQPDIKLRLWRRRTRNKTNGVAPPAAG